MASVKVFIRRIYILGLLFVVIGGLNTLIGLRHLEEQIGKEVEGRIAFTLDHVMGETSSELLNAERMLDAAEVAVRLGSNDDQIVQFFDDVLLNNSSFLAMYFAMSPTHVLYENRQFDWEPVDPTTRPWYQAATREGKLVFTGPYVDAAENRLVLTIAKPIYDPDGRLMGVLGIDKSLQGMLELLAVSKPSKRGHSFTFDETGKVLIDPEQVHQEYVLDLNEAQATPILTEPSGMIRTNLHGEDGYLRWQAVGSSGIVVGIYAPTSDFLDRRMLFMQVLGTAVLSLGLVWLFLLWFQRRHIFEPMRELDQDIMAISLDQDTTYRLPIRQRNPFEQLRDTINVSLDRVQEHFEDVVRQRQELTAAYNQLVSHEQQLQAQYVEIKQHEDHIQYLADHDALTGLLNRRRFEEDLEKLLKAGQMGSVLLFDIDDFKNINDTLGHVYGDAVLQHVARTLEHHLDPRSTPYRFGSDEFLIVVDGVVDPEELRLCVERLLEALSEPHTIEERRNRFTTSVGVVRYPFEGVSAEELLIKADIAMYNAKKMGKNRYLLFEGSMSANLAERVHIEHLLRDALQNGGFRLLYQPIVETNTGEIAYFEALIRLEGHDISPAVFIPIAEESDLIQPIGRWVIKEVIGQLVKWQDEGKAVKPISMNLSPRQFYDEGLVDFLTAELKEQGVHPALVEMEITETVFIDNATEAIKIIERIRALGVKMALDDFGTGYLAMNYITNLPVDRIKLDRSLTQEIKETIAVMGGLIAIAQGLGMDVVGEGVEKIEEAHCLAQVNCDYLQGYLFSKPIPPEQVELLLGQDFREKLGLTGSV